LNILIFSQYFYPETFIINNISEELQKKSNIYVVTSHPSYNIVTKPNYFYLVNDKRENRFNYRKDMLVKEGFDKNKTEHDIMLERKIYRIYDCGSICFKIKMTD
jgi:hypothetical protein